jgi:hypothetical protein
LKNDHLSFIYIYKKAIDEVDQQKEELWKIFEKPKTTQTRKIKTIRELHKLTITSTLLLKDLPFVTNLTKYYNKDF